MLINFTQLEILHMHVAALWLQLLFLNLKYLHIKLIKIYISSTLC